MKSTIDLEDLIYSHLKSGALVAAITGKLWKQERPVNSQYEDVVVNCLPVTNFQLQTAAANVNIHVPNLPVSVNGSQQGMTDNARLNELFKLAEAELKDTMIGDTYFDIEQQLLFKEDKSSYINIRLDFNSINI